MFVLSSAPALALDASHDVSQYAHTAWTLRDGALRGYPKSVVQTADGYLWLATDVGVLRFDGVRFVSWQPPAGARLPSGPVVRLLAARDGSLWIGTVQGLARWQDGALTDYRDLAGQYVFTLIQDHEGTVWAGTFSLQRTAKLCAIQGRRVECHGDDGALGRFVISVYEDARGNLWVGAATGLWRWKPHTPELYSMRDRFSEVHSMTEDENGTLLVAVNREIKRIVDRDLEAYRLPGVTKGPIKPTALLRDRNGGLWIGTQDQGVLHVHHGRMDQFVRADGLSGDFVNSLFEDIEGNVWVATLNGLDRFRDVVVATITSKQGLSTDTVMSVLAAKDGSVWLGTIGGLNRWKDERLTLQPISSRLTHEGVGSLFEDERGRLWVSSPRGLVYVENGSTSASVVASGYVQAIAETSPENLWVSDQERGLFHVREGRVVELIQWAALGGRNARSLSADPGQGGLWLGFFQGGVAYFKDGQVRASYTNADGLGRGEVTQLRVDLEGALWAATEGGLSRVQHGAIATLTSKNGLPCDAVRWAIEDEAHSLWLHTDCGLVRIVRSEVDAWVSDQTRTLQLTVYDSSDGVPAHSDVGSYGPKVARSGDGRLWFASYDGASVLDPRHLRSNTAVPPVLIEQVTADRKPYQPSPELRLPALVRDLRIDYTALSLTAPEKVRFRYKLEGRDQDWIDAGNRRQAFYTDLLPKAYRFHVIASNNDGMWNREGSVWSFSIQPAVYQTNGFKASGVLFVVAACWAIYRLRLARLAAQLDMRFEERLAERTRIGQELHDTLLQGALSASMQLQVVADEVIDERIKSKLDHILKRISQVNEEGRRTVQALRTDQGTSDDLDRALAREAEDFRGQQPVNIHLIVEGKRRPLHPLIRDEVYRLGREALANTFRHARATRVDIELEYAPDCLRVRIGDNGCGMPPDIVESGRPGHWGIRGMRERAERIGATLRLLTGVNAGTEVEVRVPGHVAFHRQPSDRKSKTSGRTWQT